MSNNVTWQAPFYVLSRKKITFVISFVIIFIITSIRFSWIDDEIKFKEIANIVFFLILPLIFKIKDPQLSGLSLLFYKKETAIYTIEGKSLIISYSNKREIIELNKELCFYDVVSVQNSFQYKGDFLLIYYLIKKGSVQKYKPIFFPKDMREKIEEIISLQAKYIQVNKNKPKKTSIWKMIGIFAFILASVIAILAILSATIKG